MKDKFCDIKKQIEEKHLKNGFCNICLPCLIAKNKIKKEKLSENLIADNFIIDSQLLAELEDFLNCNITNQN